VDGKQLAARAGAQLALDGMVLGLGSGSTSALMVEELGRRAREEGLQVRGVPTSRRTAELAQAVGIPLVDLNDVDHVDLAIDGADEIGPGLRLIKGGGGALLREKIVAAAAEEFVVIADDAKLVPLLGGFPLPVEVVPFGWKQTARAIGRLGFTAAIREQSGDGLFQTDQGNYVLDLQGGLILDAEALAAELQAIPGVVEHGLFLGMARRALVGGEGGVREISAK
jgi:ribose 5-phosphate isomerase A